MPSTIRPAGLSPPFAIAPRTKQHRDHPLALDAFQRGDNLVGTTLEVSLVGLGDVGAHDDVAVSHCAQRSSMCQHSSSTGSHQIGAT
jgi:hypothetical protein